MDAKKGLNQAQLEALEVTEGPLLILAGAGSGKTKTLTHRIAHLIANHGIWPNEILALTFTNKAAREMRRRLWELLEGASSKQTAASTGASRLLQGEERAPGLTPGAPAEGQAPPRSFMSWMGTFHGICVKLLKMDGHVVGVSPNFVIYDEDDRQSLIKQAMKELSVNDKQIKPRAVSSVISSAKNELVGPEDYAATAQLPFQREVARIYEKYEELRRSAGALDFDDLLRETVRMLRDHPEIRRKWRSHFKHILIDEYQDTNAAQYTIVKLLVNDTKNICVVGDDWQSIYSWRGADFTNILNFERDFPGAKVIKLEQNYRSTGAILDAAHQVITKNTQRTDKQLWTELGDGLPIEVRGAYDEAEEAYIVAAHIAQAVSSGQRRASDFAILYRMNAQSYALERALLQHHLPYQIIGGVRFYDRKEIKDIVAYLRLLVQPNDRIGFTRIVNVPTRGIGATSLEKFLRWQSQTGLDIISALGQCEQTDTLTPRAKKSLLRLGEILRTAQAKVEAEVMPSEIIEHVIEAVQYRDYLRDGTPQADDREENVGSLVSDAKNFASLGDFLDEIALMSSADGEQTDDAVTLMTIHAAKGLEFPVVFMVGLEEGIFPHSRVFDSGPEELEEERRLCYVGMTRAREQLVVCYSASRLQFGQRGYNQPSRFLADMGHEIDHGTAATPSWNTGVDDEPFYDEPQFAIGDRVRSNQFGTGEVVDIDGMAVEIEFDSGYNKKLNVEYARLEKL